MADENADEQAWRRGIENRVSAVEAAVTRMQPIADAMDRMQSGIHAIGKFGDFCVKVGCLVSKIGSRTGRFVIGAVVLWLAIKALFGYASWSDVATAIARLFGR